MDTSVWGFSWGQAGRALGALFLPLFPFPTLSPPLSTSLFPLFFYFFYICKYFFTLSLSLSLSFHIFSPSLSPSFTFFPFFYSFHFPLSPPPLSLLVIPLFLYFFVLNILFLFSFPPSILPFLSPPLFSKCIKKPLQYIFPRKAHYFSAFPMNINHGAQGAASPASREGARDGAVMDGDTFRLLHPSYV